MPSFIWMRLQIFSVGSDFSVRVLRKWRQASIHVPSLCGILVNKEEISSVTRIALSGRRLRVAGVGEGSGSCL